jgi:hypothetical protein
MTANAAQLSKTSSGNKQALYFASSFKIEKFIDLEQSKPTQPKIIFLANLIFQKYFTFIPLVISPRNDTANG